MFQKATEQVGRENRKKNLPMKNLTARQKAKPESAGGSYLVEQHGSGYLLSGGVSAVTVTHVVGQLTGWRLVLSSITQDRQHLWPQLLEIINYRAVPATKRKWKTCLTSGIVPVCVLRSVNHGWNSSSSLFVSKDQTCFYVFRFLLEILKLNIES